jgi:hypothetical protein
LIAEGIDLEISTPLAPSHTFTFAVDATRGVTMQLCLFTSDGKKPKKD